MAMSRARGNRKGKAIPPLSAITDLQRARFIENYRDEGSIEEACRRSKITRKELERLKAEDAKFAAELVEARAILRKSRRDLVEDALFNAAIRGDAGACKFILSKLDRETYGDAPILNINIEDVSKLSDDELDELIRRCQKTR